MEREDFSFLDGIARLKERKSRSRLKTIDSNIFNLVSKIEIRFSFANWFLFTCSGVSTYMRKEIIPVVSAPQKEPRFFREKRPQIFCFTKDWDYLRITIWKVVWVRLPQKLLRWWCIPIRCISIVLVMYSNLMYCFVSAIVLCVYAL